FYAVRAQCTHYRGALADGIVVGSTIRCPLHHACFDLATGDALRAPALDPLPCWRVERRDGRIFVGEPLPAPIPQTHTSLPSSIVILGGGGLRTENPELRTALLINSRSDVALAVGADGVHLRSDDISPKQVRTIWKSGYVGTAVPGCSSAEIAGA